MAEENQQNFIHFFFTHSLCLSASVLTNGNNKVKKKKFMIHFSNGGERHFISA